MFKLLSFTFIDRYWLYADCEQQPGIALPTSLATSVSYPTSRATPALQQQQSAPAIKQQRLFTGTITKLHDNFGFVDEDVFFQTRWSLFSLAYFYFCKLDCYYCTLVAEYCDDHVCPWAYLRNHIDIHANFTKLCLCYAWQWLKSSWSGSAVAYILYFQFYGCSALAYVAEIGSCVHFMLKL